MTNPDNIVRVRARNGGRASVYEANGWAQGYSSGLFEGTGVIQNTVADMNVLVGGSAAKPDVVLAENPSGYKIALDIVGQQAIAITAPASNNRVSAIVAYTDDLSLATTEDTVTGSPASCGLIVVNGTAALNPTEPTDAQIRTAITADGATGSQAAYAVLALVVVASSTTAITNSIIAPNKAVLKVSDKIADNSITASKLDFTTILEVVGTTTGSNQNYAIKYSDGRLVCVIRKTATVSISTAWGGLYGLDVSGSSIGNWAVTFTSIPVVEQSITSGAGIIISSYQQASTTTAPGVTLCRPTTISNTNIVYNMVAYGFWK